jgi:hypothetical protein
LLFLGKKGRKWNNVTIIGTAVQAEGLNPCEINRGEENSFAYNKPVLANSTDGQFRVSEPENC